MPETAERNASGGIADAWIAAVTVLAASIYSVLGPFYPADEGWALQVAHRFATGEVPYRDFYFPATPVAIWLSGGIVRLVASEFWVLRGLVLVCFAVLVVLSLATARRLDIPIAGRVAIAAGLVAFTPPGLSGPGLIYNPVAQPLLVASLLATLVWLEHRDAQPLRYAALIGLVGAVLAATKQNLGVYVLAAAICVMAYASWRGGSLRRAAWPMAAAAGVFTAATALLLSPIVLTGAWQGFMDRAYVLKATTYLRGGSIGYGTGLRELWYRLWWFRSFDDLVRLTSLFAWVLAPAAGATSVAAWARTRSPTSAAVALFTLVGVASAYPRWDVHHFAIGAPMMLLGLVYAAVLLTRPETREHTAKILAESMLALAAVALASVVLGSVAGSRVPLGLPHFAQARVTVEQRDSIVAAREDLVNHAEGATFVLSPRAGLLYLTTNRYNPLPNDYPHPTSATDTDAQRLRDGLRSGTVETVWAERGPLSVGAWRPELLLSVLASEAETRSVTLSGFTYAPAR